MENKTNSNDFKSLTSDLGMCFSIIIKIIVVGYLGFLIYFINEKLYAAILLIIIFIIMAYFKFLRYLLGSKKLEYSKDSIKIDDNVFDFSEVVKIGKGFIILKTGKRIRYNYFFSESRVKELKDLISEKRETI